MTVKVILVLACVALVGHGNVVAGHSPVSSAGIRSGTERVMGHSGGNHAAGRWSILLLIIIIIIIMVMMMIMMTMLTR